MHGNMMDHTQDNQIQEERELSSCREREKEGHTRFMHQINSERLKGKIRGGHNSLRGSMMSNKLSPPTAGLS